MKRLNISQVSAFFANGSYPIEFLFYFPNKLRTKRLRIALKKISKKFWPVFGSYNNGYIVENKYLETDYYDESVVNEAFDPDVAFESLYFKYGSVISNSIPRLFYLKVLHYTNGTVIIAKMNHLVGDGYSFFYLLSVLAATTKRGSIPFIPILLRALSKPKFHSKLHDNFHLSKEPPIIQTIYDDLVVETKEVNQSEIRSKARITTEKSGLKISTNDILTAQLLKMIQKIKSHIQMETIGLVIPVDMRRAVPELGQRYFGNGLILHRISFTSDEITQKNVEELAIKIRENFPERNLEKYTDFLNIIEDWIAAGKLENLQVYNPEIEFLVTNLSRMPVSRLDFGSGPPSKIIPLTRGKSGAAILVQDNKFILQLGR